MKNNKIKKICIAIPHTGMFHWQTLSAILGLQLPQNYALCYHLVGSCLIYDAREKIYDFAKSKGCDYVLYLDSDMVPPADTLVKMVKRLESPDIDMITGMAFKRIPPFQPCFYTKVSYDPKAMKPSLESPIEFPNEGLLPIQGAGMACAMLKMSAFDGMESPYFFPLPNLGEDLTFCLKAKHKGLKMFTDLSIDVGHVSQMPIHAEHFRACYEEYKANKKEGTTIFDGAEGGASA